jgi:hypothetical protein
LIELYFPVEQTVHAMNDDDAPRDVLYVPLKHSMQLDDEFEPLITLYVPILHKLHTVVDILLVYDPGEQKLQNVLPVWELKRPALHG